MRNALLASFIAIAVLGSATAVADAGSAKRPGITVADAGSAKRPGITVADAGSAKRPGIGAGSNSNVLSLVA